MSRDEEESLPITFKVNNPISTLDTITSRITDAWVEYNRQRVTAVPAGERFDIFVAYEARNPGNPWPQIWSVCVTVKGDSIKNYEITDSSPGNDSIIESKMHLDKAGDNIMPGSPLSLNVSLWGSPSLLHDIPPEAMW